MLPLRGARPAASVALRAVSARRALLEKLFDHAPLFPPASLPLPEALAEDRRAWESEHAWMLGRFVCPAAQLAELAGESRELALVAPGVEFDGDLYLEGVDLDEVLRRDARAKVRCGGGSVPSVEQLAAFVSGCRERALVFKATAGLHHAYPTGDEHGFLNLLAAAVFGDEEDALRAPRGSFELDDTSFRWDGREADDEELARVRATLFHSIGSCSFFEPVEELVQLGIL
jgi:hypothetical protein